MIEIRINQDSTVNVYDVSEKQDRTDNKLLEFNMRIPENVYQLCTLIDEVRVGEIKIMTDLNEYTDTDTTSSKYEINCNEAELKYVLNDLKATMEKAKELLNKVYGCE